MKLIKSKLRYKCDFCRHASTIEAMKLHEGRCYKNPNRVCDTCNNTKVVHVDIGGFMEEQDCPYCSKINPELITPTDSELIKPLDQ